MTRNAIRKTVACQSWGSKVGSLKTIRPVRVFDMKAKAAVLEQIQDVTVIQPVPNISVEHIADNAVGSGRYEPCMNPQNSLCDEAKRADLKRWCKKSVCVSHAVRTSESLPSVLRSYTGIPITSSARYRSTILKVSITSTPSPLKTWQEVSSQY
jgi:hypothetical protein